MTFQPEASHFINGAYVEDKNGQPIDVIYPFTGETIATVHSATPAIVEQALEAARAAQLIWAATAPVERGRVLLRAAEIMRDRNEELSVIETHDTGKPIQETLVADAASGAEALEFFGGLCATLTGEYIPAGNGDFVYTVPEPLGVCLGIGAWNYPMQIASWKAAPALACGNAMVFKPSETTPLTALKLAEILIEAGAPAGLFNVVQGLRDVSAQLVADPRIKKVSLTGSVPTGKKVYAAAAADLKYVTLELGGKSPILIFDDADIENAVSGVINANYYSSGQICSNGTRVFVQKGIKDAFVNRLCERLKGAVIGDPMDPEVNFGPMVSQGQLDIAMGYVAAGQEDGATLAFGGNRLDREGFFMEPTLFTGVTDDMRIAQEEIFGPVLSLLEFEDEAEGLARANDTEFGLAAGVFTQDLARAHRIAAAFQAGTCYINTYNLTPVQAPFGGVKNSGLGRENSKEAIKHYSQVKSIYVSVNDVEASF